MPKQRILPHIILGIISSNDDRVTGKEITDYVQREIGEFWQVAHSQVYPELKRMVADKWLISHAVPGNDKEKQYSMTQKGQDILEEWLSLPNEETPLQKDIFSLKLFFIRNKSDKRIPVLLRGQIELLGKHLRHLESRKENLFASDESIESHYGHYLILNRAIARNRAQLSWLKDNLAEY